METATAARLKSCWPYFLVSDLEATVDFFCDRLGSEVAHEEPDVRFVIVCRDSVFIMLRGTPHDPSALTSSHFHRGAWPCGTAPYDVSVQVSDVRALYQELAANGVDVQPPAGRPYGTDITVTLPDGYHLVFLQPG